MSVHQRSAAFWAAKAVVRAVEGVDFQIAPGETFALVGESGCGKSTLARCVVGLLAPTAGSVAFSGRRVQMIFQNPYASLNPRWRIFDIIAEPVRAYRLVDPANIERRVKELLEMVGLGVADARKYPHQFPAGSASAFPSRVRWRANPIFWFAMNRRRRLTFPQAEILNLLKDVQRQLKLSYMFISHDLPVVYQMADHVGVMYLGKIVEMAATDRLLPPHSIPTRECCSPRCRSLTAAGSAATFPWESCPARSTAAGLPISSALSIGVRAVPQRRAADDRRCRLSRRPRCAAALTPTSPPPRFLA